MSLLSLTVEEKNFLTEWRLFKDKIYILCVHKINKRTKSKQTIVNDVSSPPPQTADRDHSQCERESGREMANQSRVNNPAGQWEPGGEDAAWCLAPHPP